MAYQVLARKWRPRNFAEVAGQSHVLRALSNALNQGRLHHAYLFVGERGVGKTTLARILAKCLNCEQGVSAEPCGQCTSCLEIDEGRFIDLLELDAASHTGVDNMRELLENAQYRPTRGRYKVYLIDEAHMLSKPSFNALLKTLEEPPEHVKFLLATTEQEKLPVTVLSRCLQFNLKCLAAPVIAAQLQKILDEEQAEAESAAVYALARAAEGSLRDALSLLDQALAYGAGSLRLTEVHEMLGTAPREPWRALVQALTQADLAAALAAVAALAEQGADFPAVLDELLALLHRVAVLQACPEAADPSAEEDDLGRACALALSPEDLQLYYQIGLRGKCDLSLAPSARGGFEMIILRMLRFALLPLAEHTPQAPATRATPPPTAVAPPRPAPAAAPAAQRGVREAAQERSASPPSQAVEREAGWEELVSSLGLRGVADALARNCGLVALSEEEVSLILAEAHAGLCTDKAKQRLEEALRSRLDKPLLRLRIESGALRTETPAGAKTRRVQENIASARAAVEADPLVLDLKAKFGARLIEDSVRVLEPPAADEAQERS